MKNLFFLIFIMFLISCGNSGQQDHKTHHSNLSEQPVDTTDLTNNFYDNEKCYPLRKSYLIFAAKDGYRGVYSYSEIFNRNDQAELLLIYNPEDFDGGAFRLFPAGDFFSDRAIKSVEQIYFETLQ